MKNKKLFAILTLVCFMFTLMPVAAFAAMTPNQVYVSADAVGEQAEIAADTEIEVVSNREFKASVAGKTEGFAFFAVNAETNKGVAVSTNGTLKIKDGGDYQIFAVPTAGNKVVNLFNNANNIANELTAEVAVDRVLTQLDDSIVKAYATVTVVAPEAKYTVAVDTAKVNVKADSGFSAKGNAQVTVTLNNGSSAIIGKVPTITAPDYVTVVPANAKKVVTDVNGNITYNISANRAGEFKVVFSYEDAEDAVVKVIAKDGEISDVVVVKEAANPLNKAYNAAGINTGATVKFTDANGSAIVVEDVVANGYAGAHDMVKVSVKSQPATSKLTANNFELKASATAGATDLYVNPTADLKVGTYEVKLALENGKYVVVAFEAAKMGDAVGIRFVDPATTVALGASMTAGEFTVEAYDANGVTEAATVTLNAQGKALVNKGAGNVFTVDTDEKYVGTTVTVLAKTTDNKFVATTTLEVVDNGMEVVYVDNTAEVGVTTVLDAKVLDAKGNKVAVPVKANGKYDVKIVVLEKPANAYVYASAKVVGTVGIAKDIDVTFLGSVAGEYKIQTIVVGANNEYVTGIETITVGANANSFKDIVVMSIGATQFVVNDKVVEIPTAPIIENGRTMVPLRALIEAFGAEVVWDGAARTVTATLGDTVVVMTVGSAEYTVNGEARTADVAPYINADDFTMVPVRFVAQAFGITPTPIADATGAVVDVMFAK